MECCYQNVGIATSLALTMFRGEDLSNAMGIPFFYGMCEAFIVGSYCVLSWKAGWSKAPADKPIWDVIFRTYEILEAEKLDGGEEIEVTMSMDGGEEDRQEGNVYHHMFHFIDDLMEEEPSRRLGPKTPSGLILIEI